MGIERRDKFVPGGFTAGLSFRNWAVKFGVPEPTRLTPSLFGKFRNLWKLLGSPLVGVGSSGTCYVNLEAASFSFCSKSPRNPSITTFDSVFGEVELLLG